MDPKRQDQFDFGKYLSIARRRKWLIVFPPIPILILGILYCFCAPKVYKTSTTIVVVRQKVPESYIQSTITGDVQERIQAIWQEITSRTNLERVIEQFDLYPEMRTKYPMETVVETMRKHIKVDIPRRSRGNIFILSYEGKDPVLIAKVANALANMFIEENLKLREEQARSTSEFLAQELARMEAELLKREQAIEDFKKKYMGELPEQRQTNMAMLQRLTDQLEIIQENIRAAEDRKILLQKQLNDEIELQKRRQGQLLASPNKGEASSELSDLELLKKRLASLLTRYTEQHPDVIRLKAMIKKLEQEQGAEASSDGEDSVVEEVSNPVILGIKRQLESLDIELEKLRLEAKEVKKKIKFYQKRLENTAEREQQLVDLTRDYENLQKTYQSLLAKKIAAEQAEALERHQKGEQFRIIDPARVPEKPFKPDFKKILALTVILSLGIGFGLALAAEFLGKAFYDVEQIEEELRLPVIAAIPLVLSKEEKRRRLIKDLALTGLALVGYLMVGGLLFWLIKNNPGLI
ncbi:XrtA system polysaccharide chain length determinant [Thermosulfuriphilus sp.]